MPTFAYSGRTRGGQTVSGERQADTMDAAVAALRREQVLVTRITPAEGESRSGPARSAKPGKLGKRVSAKNLAVFTRQFSVMIDAGLPLVQCLDILGSQEEDKNFAAVILQTRTDVESGASLTDAMRKYPKTFDPLFTNMIAAGEAGGILDTILKRLATYIEKAVKLTNQVKSAMIYPVAVIVIAESGRRRDSVEGDSDLRAAVCRSWRRAAGADPSGHLAQQRSRGLRLAAVRRADRCWRSSSDSTTRPTTAVAWSIGCSLMLPVLGNILRKIAVARFCRTLVDAHQLRRPDSRRSRDYRQDLRQCGHRGRHHGDAHVYRARRNDRRAAEGRAPCFRRW